MSETVLQKSFTERDLKRIRNLVQKKTSDKILTSVGYTKKEEIHLEGEVWEENGRKWTMRNGIKCTIRKIENTGLPLLCPKCSRPLKHRLDKQMYGIHQMCLYCTTEMESELKMQGKYEEYEKNMITNNAKYYVELINNGIDQLLDDISNGAYVTEDGTIQNWIGSGMNKKEIKRQVMNRIDELKSSINF